MFFKNASMYQKKYKFYSTELALVLILLWFGNLQGKSDTQK